LEQKLLVTSVRVKLVKPRPTGIARTAYHEAGHAVAHLRFASPFRYASIIPNDEGSLGRVLAYKYRTFDPDVDTSRRTTRLIERDSVILLSGLTAEKKYSGRSNYRGAGSDFRSADDLLNYLCGSSEETYAYLRLQLVRAKQLWTTPQGGDTIWWNGVVALAKKLLEVKRMKFRPAREIVYEGVYGLADAKRMLEGINTKERRATKLV